MIQFVANLLTDTIPAGNFVGHIGGDDFIAILNTYDIGDVCSDFIRRFDEGIRAFYSKDDLDSG